MLSAIGANIKIGIINKIVSIDTNLIVAISHSQNLDIEIISAYPTGYQVVLRDLLCSLLKLL